MEVDYQGHANDNGIYRIRNKLNGREYYGSCLRFKSRHRSHSNTLIAGTHSNRFMQADFNKCGKEAFVFEVVEVVNGDRSARLEREQVYVSEHFDNGIRCYNLRKQVCDTREGKGNTNVSNPLTDGRCKPFSEERKAKHTEKLKEVWTDPELKEISRQNSLKRWEGHSANIVVSHKETGEKVLISGSVKQFCLERGLSYKAFNQLVKGKIKSSGGWYLGEEKPVYVDRHGEKRKPLTPEQRNKHSSGKYAGIKLVNADGNELVIATNVKEQCRELGMHYTTLLKVLKGICKTVNGYRKTCDM